VKVVIAKDIMVPFFDFYPYEDTIQGAVMMDSNGTLRVADGCVTISADTALRWTKTKVALEAMQSEMEAEYERQNKGETK